MKGFAAAIMITVAILCMGVAKAQVPAPGGYSPRDLEIAGSFTTVRANAAPTDCGCFFMYGGNAQAALVGQKGVGVIADFGRTSANNINGDGNNLTLSTYMGGVRYVPRFQAKKFSTYVQALVGVAHTSSNFAIDANATRLAASAGGGINYVLTRRWDVRVLEASYLMTRIPNAAKIPTPASTVTTGVVFHFSRSGNRAAAPLLTDSKCRARRGVTLIVLFYPEPVSLRTPPPGGAAGRSVRPAPVSADAGYRIQRMAGAGVSGRDLGSGFAPAAFRQLFTCTCCSG